MSAIIYVYDVGQLSVKDADRKIAEDIKMAGEDAKLLLLANKIDC